ncbi:potassium transporter [Gordonia sp. ABSL49_1]|uniref:potassium transporter n=1 Tax=Gordonia sp. ABSL49_1 TaxID=2920941 RepID=UPI001F0D2F2F|nr:potassium transporter [Gordonia sp. ABSL49_1]MCH5645156.1 potassium transporter [Gordonia sp. ABSL49_1]
MDLSLRTETIGAGDQSWLGSSHGTDACRTVTINRSALTKGTHYPDNRLKSGMPLALVSGKYVPYNAGGSGGTEILAGFLFTDQSVRDTGGDIVAPLLDHGRVKLAKLPFTVTASATTTGQFIWV